MDSPKNDPVNPQQQPVSGTPAPAPPIMETPAAVEAATEAARADAPETPLTPGQWLTQNGIYLGILVGGMVLLYRAYGWGGLPSAFKTIFGIGFIIFIHELGHFLVAKWCDVHVITFSIGFGPAIPGCSFKRGETTYKIALLPLGGYVNMVGEGSDADEGEDYPRSFKNKSVWQRMAIISAGVIMNVIFGIIAFMFVYRTQGVERTRAVIAGTVPGSAAWIEGVPSGARIDRIGSNSRPTFEALKGEVALSGKDEQIDFKLFNPYAKTEIDVQLVPRKGEGMMPVVGIIPPSRLELLGTAYKQGYGQPVSRKSAAEAARAVTLKSGDVVLSASDPDDPDRLTPLTPLPGEDWTGELARRLLVLTGKPVKLTVQRPGASAEVTLGTEGFDWGDVIVGCSMPAGKDYDPFRLSELPPDPRVENSAYRDFFKFRERLRLLAGKPIVVQVKRANTNATVNVFVPPAYHLRFGARMRMGKVTAVRRNSPAQTAGVRGSLTSDEAPDEISGVQIANEGRTSVLILGDRPKNAGKQREQSNLDPVRLPFQLAEFAARHHGKKCTVTLTVVRKAEKDGKEEGHTLRDVLWDDSFGNSIEMPAEGGPMSIPQLGLAYQVNSLIDGVEEGSPAALAMRVEEKDGVSAKVPDALRKGDVITGVRFWERGASESGWSDEENLSPTDKPEDRWAYIGHAIQRGSSRAVQFTVRREGSVMKQPIEVVLENDPAWPMTERGLLLAGDTDLFKAYTNAEALGYGWSDTTDFIGKIYLGLRRVVTGRVSSKSFEGPIGIVSTTFKLAQDDNYRLILFLGILSINLAVVNFLPIPLLDGGHMVFLIYEKLRGKPPSEGFRNIAAYVGLALLLALMIYVFYLDIAKALGIIRR